MSKGNAGAALKRMMNAIEAAGAKPKTPVILSVENTLRGADVCAEITRDVPGATMATLSGSFLCKVFEGPYRNMRTRIEAMKALVQGRGKTLRRLYVFYTTCPTCAKKHGNNYVAIPAQV